MGKLKVKLNNIEYEVLSIHYIKDYSDSFDDYVGEAVYIEFGKDYMLHGQLYAHIDEVNFKDEFILNWDEID